MKNYYQILLVDDTIKNLQLLCELLQENPAYKLNAARSGLEALEVTKSIDFDLILLDLQMPHMDGFEVCRRLKENPKTKDIPVIFLTAQTDNQSTVKGLELGAADYINKPFSYNELQMRIQTHLELNRHRNALEGIVKERTILLEDALEQINEDNLVKEEFLATMSHEVRTPLNGITGIATLLKSTSLDIHQEKLLDSLKESANYLQNIIDDLFDFTQIHIGSLILDQQNFCLRSLITDIAQNFKEKCERKNLEFGFEINESLPTSLLCDRNILQKVILHLLSNALKFTEKGKININIFTENCDDKLFIIIKVSDTGIGIHSDNYSKIFNKLTQLDSSNQRSYEGTGMGLTICKELLDKLGCCIDVESVEMQGTTFTVKILHTENASMTPAI